MDLGNKHLGALLTGSALIQVTDKIDSTKIAKAEIKFRKQVKGREWKDNDEFGVRLTPEDGAKLPDSAESGSTSITTTALKTNGLHGSDRTAQYVEKSFGSITFAASDFERAPKTLTYTLCELKSPTSDECTPVGYKANDLTYDATKYQVKVTLSQAQDGTLSTSVKYYKSDGTTELDNSEVPPMFVNTPDKDTPPIDQLPHTGADSARTWMLVSGVLFAAAALAMAVTGEYRRRSMV